MGKRRKPKHEYHYVEPIPSYYHTSKFKIEIRDSNIKGAGQGVFTAEEIPENTLIDDYLGTYQSIPTSRYYFYIKEGVGIDAGNYPRSYMGMINDSFNSNFHNNCTFIIDETKNTVSVESLRHIEAGEELFISYGDSYWNC
jgi:hypothetical protein